MSQVEVLTSFCAFFATTSVLLILLLYREINTNANLNSYCKSVIDNHNQFLVEYILQMRKFEREFKRIGYNTSEMDGAIKDFENRVISEIDFEVK